MTTIKTARKMVPTREERMNAAWTLVLAKGHSRRAICITCGVSRDTVTRMRRTAKRLETPVWDWDEARRLAS